VSTSAATARTGTDGPVRSSTTSDASPTTAAEAATGPTASGSPTSTATTIHVTAAGPASRRSASDGRNAPPSAAPDTV